MQDHKYQKTGITGSQFRRLPPTTLMNLSHSFSLQFVYIMLHCIIVSNIHILFFLLISSTCVVHAKPALLSWLSVKVAK